MTDKEKLEKVLLERNLTVEQAAALLMIKLKRIGKK
jgi:hypothetical protein